MELSKIPNFSTASFFSPFCNLPKEEKLKVLEETTPSYLQLYITSNLRSFSIRQDLDPDRLDQLNRMTDLFRSTPDQERYFQLMTSLSLKLRLCGTETLSLLSYIILHHSRHSRHSRDPGISCSLDQMLRKCFFKNQVCLNT